jgi:hypothetical protein
LAVLAATRGTPLPPVRQQMLPMPRFREPDGCPTNGALLFPGMAPPSPAACSSATSMTQVSAHATPRQVRSPATPLARTTPATAIVTVFSNNQCGNHHPNATPAVPRRWRYDPYGSATFTVKQC